MKEKMSLKADWLLFICRPIIEIKQISNNDISHFDACVGESNWKPPLIGKQTGTLISAGYGGGGVAGGQVPSKTSVLIEGNQ